MRLIRTMLAAALLAVSASTASAAVGNPGPDRFRLEPALQVERVQRFGLTSDGLTLRIFETCGAAANDGVIVSGQACAVTFEVTDEDDNPISGASLVMGDRLPENTVTNGNGQFSTDLTISGTVVAYVDASHAGRTGQGHLYSVSSGRGLVFVEMKDRHGFDLLDWSAAVGVDMWPTAWYQSGSHALNVIAGTGRMAISADLGNGQGYVLQAEGVQIPSGGRVTVALDGQNSHPIQASVVVNGGGTPQTVSGAMLFPTRDQQPPLYLRDGILTGSDGIATIYVTPGTYQVAALGGNPGIFAEAAGVVVSTQPVNLQLAAQSDLTLAWAFSPATAPTEQKLIVTGGLGGDHPLIQIGATTLHMAPGSYTLVTDLTYDLPDEYWTYRLHHNPGSGTFTYGAKTYQSATTYNFSDAGPWALTIGGPARIETGQAGTYALALAGANAIIDWIDGIRWDPFEQYGQPDVTVTSAEGDHHLTTQSWSPSFSSNQEGIYYIEGTLPVMGPLLLPGATFTSTRTIGVGVNPGEVTIVAEGPDGDLRDHLLVADGQPKQVKITVQRDGSPVDGALVFQGPTLLGTTDVTGRFETSVVSDLNQVIKLRITSQVLGDHDQDLILAKPGWTWVAASLKGVDGSPVYGVQVYDQNQQWLFGSSGAIAAGFVTVAEPSLVVVANPAPGLGYHYQVTQALVAGQPNKVNPDAQAVLPHEIRRQVLATTQSGFATGAQVHLQGVPASLTDGNGRIKLFVSGNVPYELAVTSTHPRLLAIKAGIVPSPSWADVDLRDQATGRLDFEASSPTGQYVSGVMSASLWGSGFSYQVGDPGTYRVTNGAYTFTASLDLSDQDGAVWTYHFVPRSPGLVRQGGLLMQPGKVARFDVGGPLAPVLTSSAFQVATFRMQNASNALDSMRKQGDLINPAITWTKIGTLDQVVAAMTETGPLFGNQEFTARAVLNRLPVGSSVWLNTVAAVGPGDGFRVTAATNIPDLASVNLEILFDPAVLSLNLDQSPDVTQPQPGRAVWTTHSPGAGPTLTLDLAFAAVADVYGEALIRLGPGTAISTTAGPVYVNVGDSLVTVAKNKVEVEVNAGTVQVPAALAMIGSTVKVGRIDQGTNIHNLHDLPNGMVQILGSASGFLSSSTIQAVPEFGSVAVPKLDLRWGDLNGDGQIDMDDLDLIAARMNGKTAFAGQVDTNGQGVDILDLIKAARNLGQKSDPPVTQGTLNLLVTAPILNGQSLWIQATPVGSVGAIASALIDLGTGLSTREAAALLNLPTGHFQINVQIQDGLALHEINFTAHMMPGLATKVYLSYE